LILLRLCIIVCIALLYLSFVLFIFISLTSFDYIIVKCHRVFRSYFSTDKDSGNNTKLIWVYDITKFDIIGYAGDYLVKFAPFKTKTECANILGISRSTVATYLDSGKLLLNKLSVLLPCLFQL
jgi:hypothetical protein